MGFRDIDEDLDVLINIATSIQKIVGKRCFGVQPYQSFGICIIQVKDGIKIFSVNPIKLKCKISLIYQNVTFTKIFSRVYYL